MFYLEIYDYYILELYLQRLRFILIGKNYSGKKIYVTLTLYLLNSFFRSYSELSLK